MALADFLKMIENEYKVKTSGQDLPDSLRQIITRAYNEGVDYARERLGKEPIVAESVARPSGVASEDPRPYCEPECDDFP